MDLLRLTTAGSVDDGKSTLIGRLLFDTKTAFEDELEAVEGVSQRRGDGHVNLALLTDGLRAEREQNITIDVAYRYFATPSRKFIIADTPGHEQYTRNMVTGASTAQLAIVLIDARHGVLTQSRRHGFISSLLRIPHILVAINKMDLVNWSEEIYERIVADYTAFAEKLGVEDLTFIPISALLGDNVVNQSENMPWYRGSTLLYHLEHVRTGGSRNLVDFRFPVQYVIRPNQDYRGYAGRVASGAIHPGDQVMVLPSGQQTNVASIDTLEGPLEEASAGDSVSITTTDELDISRGNMLVRPLNLPFVDSEIDALICWTASEPMKPGRQYWLRQTTQEVKAFISRVLYRIDMDTLHRDKVDLFELNDIGRIQIQTAQPIFFDRYELNRETGSFILIDPQSNNTVAAGMIREPIRSARALRAISKERDLEPRHTSPNVVWDDWNIPLSEREIHNKHQAVVIWFTGLSGSGKTSIASTLERHLFTEGYQTMLLDGDQVRHGLNGDLAFTPQDRTENIRRAGEVASLFFRQGNIVICTFVSPFREDRQQVRNLVPPGFFVEVFVDTPLQECERRDPKGLYARARKGEIADMTGLTSPYEPPEDAEIVLQTEGQTVGDSVEEVIRSLSSLGFCHEPEPLV